MAPRLTDGPARAVLVQHGEKEQGPGGALIPGDPGLSERGRDQARRVAAALAGERPVAIVSSPLTRARRTVQPLAETTGLPVLIDPRLRERANLEAGDDPQTFLRDWRRSVLDRAWVTPGGRSSAATAADMRDALDEHAQRDRVVVLACHGGATADLLRTLLGDEALEARSPGLIEGSVPPGALTRLRRDGRGWAATSIADTAHLDTLGP